eukprot:TRINITY_DN34_c0_g1_i9.p2 TRINITY_DN34_c0_g1~~TRINITY_DN34_c0_g1_i9.p2  ORF type:complete len:107 (-),score=16.17 TRINITY_DN34_c0_g1_i9:46-366(-)
MLQPHDHFTPAHLAHPLVMGLCAVILSKKVCPCPGLGTLLWALFTLPGMIATYTCLMFPPMLVASWYAQGVITMFAQLVVIAIWRRLVCGGKCCKKQPATPHPHTS